MRFASVEDSKEDVMFSFTIFKSYLEDSQKDQIIKFFQPKDDGEYIEEKSTFIKGMVRDGEALENYLHLYNVPIKGYDIIKL
jgi:hypothetical protein